MADTVQGVRKIDSDTSFVNAMSFMIKNQVRGMVNTALPVVVTGVDPGGTDGAAGYVDVKPMVTQTDATGGRLDPVDLFHLPYFRIQAGTAAIVIDPVVGDIGLAIFAQSDCSTLGQDADTPVQPGSFRRFDQADGFYIGGFLNAAPTSWIEMTQDGKIKITGTLELTGGMTVTDDIVAGSISLRHHIHTGDSGGHTSEPIGGSS